MVTSTATIPILDAHQRARQLTDQAENLLLDAARWEETAAEEAADNPTKAELYASAAALYYRGGKPAKARALTMKGLTCIPTGGASKQLLAIQWAAATQCDGDDPYQAAMEQYDALMNLIYAADETLRWLEDASVVFMPSLREATEQARTTVDGSPADYWDSRPRLWMLLAGSPGQVILWQVAATTDIQEIARLWADERKAAVWAVPLAAAPTDVLAWPKAAD